MAVNYLSIKIIKSLFFFEKNGEILFEKNIKNKFYYVKHKGFWEVLQTKYELSYVEVQSFIEIVFEDLLKSQGYKAASLIFSAI